MCFSISKMICTAPSVWDLATDVQFAENLDDNGLAFLSYLFISLPGIVCALSLLHNYLGRCFSRVLANIITLLFMCCLIVSGVVFAVIINFTWGKQLKAAAVGVLVMKILAMVVGSVILGVKVLAVFVHTENMMMMSVKATSYEGMYESTLQASLVMYVWLNAGNTKNDREELDIHVVASSLLMVGKCGAESFLAFGEENKLCGRNVLSRIKLVSKFIPVFLLTSFFRMSTISMCLAWDGVAFAAIFLPASLLLPLLVLLLLKICGRLSHYLSVADLVQGTMGELTSIVLWGNTGREGSRIIQTLIGGYFLILYSTMVLLLNNSQVIALPLLGITFKKQRGCNLPLEMITCSLLSGMIGFSLFLYQLLLYDQYRCDWRKKIHNLGVVLAGH